MHTGPINHNLLSHPNMFGLLFLVSCIWSEPIWAFNTQPFQNCLHLNFVIRDQIDQTNQFVSPSVAVDLNHLSDEYSDSLVKEWKHQCLAAFVLKNQTETEWRQILTFMFRIRANSKSLILPQSFQTQVQWAIDSIHRGFEIIVTDSQGAFVRYPILGIEGARGQKFQVGHLVVWPYMFIGDNGQLFGTDVEMVNIMSRKFGFAYDITRFSRTLRKKLENGTEIGVYPSVSISRYCLYF